MYNVQEKQEWLKITRVFCEKFTTTVFNTLALY